MERRFFSCIDKIGINNYLTIIPLEDGLQAKLSDNECEYCIDGNGYWKVLPAGEFTETVNAGHTLSFRANLTPKADIGVGTFAVNKYFNLKGNCLSLLYGDDAKHVTSLPNYSFMGLFNQNNKLFSAKELILPSIVSDYCFQSMFAGCTSLIDTPKLPAIIMKSLCYQLMFSGCTSLIMPPELPATTLAFACYNGMFTDCTLLTQAPVLPAVKLSSYCYQRMFQNCTSLIKAPELLAAVLTTNCYNGMFIGCSKLDSIKMLATDISAIECLINWVDGVAASGTLVKSKDAKWDVRGVNGIPEGWTVITE